MYFQYWKFIGYQAKKVLHKDSIFAQAELIRSSVNIK